MPRARPEAETRSETRFQLEGLSGAIRLDRALARRAVPALAAFNGETRCLLAAVRRVPPTTMITARATRPTGATAGTGGPAIAAVKTSASLPPSSSTSWTATPIVSVSGPPPSLAENVTV